MRQIPWQYRVRAIADITKRIAQLVDEVGSTFVLRLRFCCFLHDQFLQTPMTAVNSYGCPYLSTSQIRPHGPTRSIQSKIRDRGLDQTLDCSRSRNSRSCLSLRRSASSSLTVW